MIRPEEAELLEEMKSFTTNPDTSRISFILAMREDDKLILHPRNNQPCFGELRKYYLSHPDEYTNPEPFDNYRPSDLKSPFPSGKPEALGVSLGYGHERADFRPSTTESTLDETVVTRDNLIKFLVSDKSPWRKGFSGEVLTISQEVPTRVRKDGTDPDLYYRPGNYVDLKSEMITGVIFTDLQGDPTVLVNLLNNLRHLYSKSQFIKNTNHLMDNSDISILELLAFGQSLSVSSHVSNCDFISYYCPRQLDWGRFKEGNPRDLTGGLLSDRYDYNRRRLHEIFEVSLYDWDNDKYPNGTPKTIKDLMGRTDDKLLSLFQDETQEFVNLFREALEKTVNISGEDETVKTSEAA